MQELAWTHYLDHASMQQCGGKPVSFVFLYLAVGYVLVAVL
jgi:hypothetical protein